MINGEDACQSYPSDTTNMEQTLLQLRHNMTGIYINQTDLGCYRSDVDCVLGINGDALANNFGDL
jgi:hypothetical protein